MTLMSAELLECCRYTLLRKSEEGGCEDSSAQVGKV